MGELLPLFVPGFALEPAQVMSDVYFRSDFVALQAHPDLIDGIEDQGFRHSTAIRAIANTALSDLETPHGYGGPVAPSLTVLGRGLAEWKHRQRQKGRIAELIRFHPCLNPEAFADQLDYLQFNRPTVMIDLGQTPEQRLAGYTVTTRQNVRKARRTLNVRQMEPGEWPLFKHLYEHMLLRQQALPQYYFSDYYYRELFSKDWCYPFLVEYGQEPLATACFLSSEAPLAHYHLSGANDSGLRHRAHYVLIDEACDHFARRGKKWLHLGGCRTRAADDSLWLFKAQFSPIHARFFMGGIVHDPAGYAGLGGMYQGLFQGYRVKPAGQGAADGASAADGSGPHP